MSQAFACSELELEIRRQVAINNHAWCLRIFRRVNRDPTTKIRITFEGVSHASFRRHFGDWPLESTATLAPQRNQGTADRAQAHHFASLPCWSSSKKDPYFVNRTLSGALKPKKKRRKLVNRGGQSAVYSFNYTGPRTDVIVKKETRSVSIDTNTTDKLLSWLDFRRFQSKHHGGAANLKLYQGGTKAFVTGVKVTYKHHWHAPKVVCEIDTAKLFQSPKDPEQYIVGLPWDRTEEQADVRVLQYLDSSRGLSVNEEARIQGASFVLEDEPDKFYLRSSNIENDPDDEGDDGDFFNVTPPQQQPPPTRPVDPRIAATRERDAVRAVYADSGYEGGYTTAGGGVCTGKPDAEQPPDSSDDE